MASTRTRCLDAVDAVFMIIRESMRLVDVQRQRRDCICSTQELLDVLHEDVNLIQEKPYVPEPDDADEARDGLVIAARDALRRSRLRDKSLISDLFQGQLVAKKTCKVCARLVRQVRALH